MVTQYYKTNRLYKSTYLWLFSFNNLKEKNNNKIIPTKINDSESVATKISNWF